MLPISTKVYEISRFFACFFVQVEKIENMNAYFFRVTFCGQSDTTLSVL